MSRLTGRNFVVNVKHLPTTLASYGKCQDAATTVVANRQHVQCQTNRTAVVEILLKQESILPEAVEAFYSASPLAGDNPVETWIWHAAVMSDQERSIVGGQHYTIPHFEFSDCRFVDLPPAVIVAESHVYCFGSHPFARQLAGLLDPGGELGFVEGGVLVDVEVADSLVLGFAGGGMGRSDVPSYRPQVNDEREVFLDVLEKLVIRRDELAPLPFCQGD
ncbi:MAG TPA: hypothetical protein VFV87_13560, partial [Pirellulaceae bacterium]|nr:hypothetical protein [Pirellulaceae bacterium]